MLGRKSLDFDVVTTRGGDKGESGLYSGERLPKHDAIFEAVGELDHLNSTLGLAKVALNEASQRRAAKFVDSIQSDIIALSALIATKQTTREGRELYSQLREIDDKDIQRIERHQQKLLQGVEIKPVFVNPGENRISAWFDVARTQARAAERRIVAVIRDHTRTDLYAVQRYVNRLSDVLFVTARFYGQDYEEKYLNDDDEL
jgi:ATP:cob(I)alamin adenosyltransferase